MINQKISLKLKNNETQTKGYISFESLKGLYYIPNFITPEESELFQADLLSNPNWVGVSSNPTSRKVIQYGYTYPYTGGTLQPTTPIPELYQSLIPRFNAFIKENIDDQDVPFDQLIINQYLSGQGIAAHIDHTIKFGAIIACVSLGSGIEITFTRTGYDAVKIYVEPNSLYIMSDEARYLWKHAIAQRKSDNNCSRGTRISLTFREALEK
jgi:alkylated DNA repair dioxygenase AlkB